MYLKSIEIQGFKSFANKTLLEFHNGITGIVGPNGSGKSNIADAVRWVLGEQRAKQLRGASMQDVIFSGTEMRKPLSYASVSITLDNSDHQLAVSFNEVTVTRKVYRSGESEYLMNGAPCRLKDINEIFYDTGIGKEGYSIIGQGQIEKILNGKPEERRELFDEAAGIVKFKRRKATALKKLEEESSSLVRINDIIGVLETRKEPLEKQSETAKIYLEKKEKLKSLEITSFYLDGEQSRKEMEELESKIHIAQDQYHEASHRLESAKREMEELMDKSHELENEINKTKDQVNEAKLTRTRLENQIDLLKEQINTAKTNDEHIQNRLDTILQEKEEREDALADLQMKLADFDKEDAILQEAVRTCEGELTAIRQEIQGLETQIEQNNAKIISLLNERASIRGNLQRYAAIEESDNLRKSQIQGRLMQIRGENDFLKDRGETLSGELAEINAKIDACNEKFEGAKKEEETTTRELREANDRLEAVRGSYHREASRLEALKNMAERYDGYGNSIRQVMDQKKHNAGIIGVVADLIKTDKKYETAIETALGGRLQNIVTNDNATADEMIAMLKRNKAGRATFLPLTNVKENREFPQKGALKEAGVIGTAGSLVNAEARFGDLVENLLGRILVVDTVAHAHQIAGKYRHSFQIVTLEGESLAAGGAITGGAFKNNSNLLGRKREIEDLTAKKEQLEKSLSEVQQLIDSLKDRRNAARDEKAARQEELQELQLSLNTLSIENRQTKEKQQNAQDEVEALNKESGQIEEQLRMVYASRDKINEQVTQSEAYEEELNKEITELTEKIESKRLDEQDAAGKLEATKLRAASSAQNVNFHKENMDRINGEIEKLDAEYKELDSNSELAAEEIAGKQMEIFTIRDTIESSYGDENEANRKIREMTEEREATENLYRKTLDQREALQEEANELDKELFRLNNRMEKVEETTNAQVAYMWDEYGVTLSEAKDLAKEDLGTPDQIRKMTKNLQGEIKRLGPVNVNAIEEYRELLAQYTLFTTQRDDLEAAKASLMEVIEELDEGMRKQFKEQFSAIAIEFEKAFKELFGGGKASLALSEDGDILEAGIIINAQPPGKKLQNMMQLSGGEKALTAISLLFAIQNLKPSPFCLLDEIEAALDDSNVGRFAGYLNKLTANTQFIIITHRRGTMTAADRLYGVTMQEKGVTALVSVDLVESELDK